MTIETAGAPAAARAASTRASLGWALRRALLGIAILTVVVAGAAWLLYSSIDPVQEAQGEGAEPFEQQVTQKLPSVPDAKLQ